MALSNISLACIGGSFAHRLFDEQKLSGQRLGPRKTPFGISQPIYECENAAGRFRVLLRHSDGPVPIASSFANHRANIFALKELGATHIVSWSGARAVSHNYRIGQFVLADDLIDDTRRRTGTFFEHGALLDLRQWPVFCPTVRSALTQTLGRLNLKFSENGTYLCSEGPRRETRAEVRKYALWGADLLGHSLAPEAFLARELQICYASLCLINDFAETGSVHRPYDAGSLFNSALMPDAPHRALDALAQIPAIMETLLTILPQVPSDCTCPNSLNDLIEQGLLARDFREWFEALKPARTSVEDIPLTPPPLTLSHAAKLGGPKTKTVTVH